MLVVDIYINFFSSGGYNRHDIIDMYAHSPLLTVVTGEVLGYVLLCAAIHCAMNADVGGPGVVKKL